LLLRRAQRLSGLRFFRFAFITARSELNSVTRTTRKLGNELTDGLIHYISSIAVISAPLRATTMKAIRIHNCIETSVLVGVREQKHPAPAVRRVNDDIEYSGCISYFWD